MAGPILGEDDGSTNYAVYGAQSNLFSNHYAVWGDALGPLGTGVLGQSNSGHGVIGYSRGLDAILGQSFAGSDTWWSAGVAGVNENVGEGAWAGYFTGKVFVSQEIRAPIKHFMIDHPIDPANKYLYHSSVESPDMKNLYDGVVALDNNGEAEIELPNWFSALNKDFRYQLTAIGAPGPNLYIAEEISEANTSYSKSNKNNNSHFKIAGGTSGMKVSWQVTGVRNDPYAKAHPIQVEKDKSEKERGLYIHPEVYGQAVEKRITLDNLRKDKVAPK
jgi:hypothetical protein